MAVAFYISLCIKRQTYREMMFHIIVQMLHQDKKIAFELIQNQSENSIKEC